MREIQPSSCMTRTALERGADAVVGKPFDVHELEHLIVAATGRARP